MSNEPRGVKRKAEEHEHVAQAPPTHDAKPGSCEDVPLTLPFSERIILQLALLAEEFQATEEISDGLRAKLVAILAVKAKFADELKRALGDRIFGSLLGKTVPGKNDALLNNDLNRIRKNISDAYHEELGAIVEHMAEVPNCDDGVRDADVIVRFKNKHNILMFASHHIEATTENALSIVDSDLQSCPSKDIFVELAELFCDNVLTYPFKRFHCKPADELMYNLRCYSPQFAPAGSAPHNIRFSARYKGELMFPLQFCARDLCIVHDDSDYDNMDVLVDIFQEEQRLAARRQDQTLSPLELWRKKDFVASTLGTVLRKHGRVDSHTLREHLYDAVKECTQFKPSLAVAVIKHFHAHRMLDFSAGWGDRLAGAIAADVDKYVAYDPNTALKAGHDEIIRRYVPADRRKRFQITYTGFEDAVLRDNDFDLVFTSPPFFDFEIYTDLPGQSVATYRALNDWLVHFLLKCLQKAWQALCPGGHVVIHITDVFKTKVCEPMCLLMQSQLLGAQYLGVITSVGKIGRPRPMWVFRKQKEPASQARIQAATAELLRLFPDVHATLQHSLAPKE